MMVLAAVLLVIGLIALAGMVARVNQLGSQTAVESNQAILGELPPLADAVEDGVIGLMDARAIPSTTLTAASPAISTTTPLAFTSSDIGLAVTGTGLPAGARILSVESPTDATLTAPATQSGVVTVSVGRFALTSSSTPTLQDGIVAMLEQLQDLEANHGLLMDYQVNCDSTSGSPDPAKGVVIVHLSDGAVWVEVRTSSAAYFTRSSCDSISG
jgi:hypothetical protein